MEFCEAGGIWTQKELVKKIYFPREVLPISHVTCQLVNMLLSFIVVFAALIVSGKGVRIELLPYLIPVIFVEYLLALGIAFVTSSLTVYFRDLEHILGVVALAWQFLSPIMYSIDDVPERWRGIFMLNPMSSVIIAYRDILYYQQVPHMKTLLMAVSLGVLFLILGWFLFGRLERHFVEEL